jgi:hypothetical protein
MKHKCALFFGLGLLLFLINSSGSWADRNTPGRQPINLKDRCMEVLTKALHGPSPMHRVWALEALGEIGKRETIP